MSNEAQEFEEWLKKTMPMTYRLAVETEEEGTDEEIAQIHRAKAVVLDMRTCWKDFQETLRQKFPEGKYAGADAILSRMSITSTLTNQNSLVDMREQFEQWAINRYGENYVRFEPDTGKYDIRLIQSLWESWQESRITLINSVSADDIKKIFLDNGFKLKTQENGTEDLNHYVYDAAIALIEHLAGTKTK